ncbi:MAG TPA: 3-hydroxyacyl-CoA dehydrogenase family protein [Candidatus Poseidoniales archaeon]|jgi:3-hydroxybutyryl-CoA dehydrogenase|nr:MAG: 3-hydroxybutyryl-CoA dehydrogenase [Euryarchaeota archaeon]HIG04093.1 3-hydroxyacyl-CoA dehydrogenase family protein [Candidatus Poseidoniales archaeon]HIK78676.1 3-hydroxyacyl-CoA dehydrogenase family protein [Candidatus Poseidoniales archaeon]
MGIQTVAVIGAGTMGSGIAQICAQAGWKTNLFDAYPNSLTAGMSRIDAFWNKGIARGKTTQSEKDLWQANLNPVSDMAEAVLNADLIIEAVPEIPSLKQEIFSELDRLAPPHAILGTNTSSLSIAEIASATSRPEKVIGMHFFNPVPIMKLLELVKHDNTSQETIDFAEKAATAMGKTSILVKDVPGFATSRLGVVLGNEAIRMLADGVASASDIDAAMVLGYRHPMGPLALSDLVGLDVRRDILLNLQKSFDDDSYAPHPLLEALVSEGSVGKKSSKGIYDWTTGEAVDRDDLPSF